MSREAVKLPWCTDVSSDVADIVRSEGGDELVQRVRVSDTGDSEVESIIFNESDILTLIGDSLAEHRPEDVPQRDDFSVVTVDIEVDRMDNYAIIETDVGGEE